MKAWKRARETITYNSGMSTFVQLLILRSATNKTGSRQKFVSQLASQNIPISFSFLSLVRNLINSGYGGYCDVYFNR